jgi:hypothetical protein
MQQLQMRGTAAEVTGAEVANTEADTVKKLADARAAGMPDMAAPQQPQECQLSPETQDARVWADIRSKEAGAEDKLVQADRTRVDAALAPQQTEHQARMDAANFQQRIRDREEDRKVAARKTVAT